VRSASFLAGCCTLALGWMLGCHEADHVPKASSALQEGTLARVGPLEITRGMLKLWSPPSDPPALDGLVTDGLFALESRARTAHRAVAVERGALARALVEHLRTESLLAHPPRPEELKRVTGDNWLRFDRPRAVRTVVIRVPVPPMADDTKYRAVADQLRAAAQGSYNVESLLQKVSTVTTDVEVQRMRLPPLAADGRVVPMLPQDHEMQRVEPKLARIVSGLLAPGELSEVFSMSDAYQFVLATEVIEASLPADQKAQHALQQLVAAQRVKPTLLQITEKRKAKALYSQKDVPALLKLVWRE